MVEEGIEVGHFGHADGAKIVEHDAVVVERVAADVDADEFALAVELFQVAPAFKDHGGFGLADLHFFASAEE